MTSDNHSPAEVHAAKKRWETPRVRTVTPLAQAPVLLCTTGTPFLCEGGGCCDVDPDCSTICNGG